MIDCNFCSRLLKCIKSVLGPLSRRARSSSSALSRPDGVIERADQKLEEDFGGGITTVVEAADALAELLANFVERSAVPMPDRQNAS